MADIETLTGAVSPNDIGEHPGYDALRKELLTTYAGDWVTMSGSVCEIARIVLLRKTEQIKMLLAEIERLKDR